MAQESVFGLHTAEFKKWISRKEANSIKAFFNLNPDEKLTGNTCFYRDGITKLWIEEVTGRKPRYYLHMIINFSRVLGISNYRAMPYTTGNVKKVFTAINKVLKALPLSDSNAVFPDWTTVRFDSVFDIFEDYTELLMWLLNQSVNLSDRKKRCKRIPIRSKTAQELECQSMRFGNNSFTYNIYRKIEEIQDKGKTITEEEKAEVQHLLRIERQNHQDAVKKLLPNMKASDLANGNVHDDILKTMIDEVELFFGKGNFLSWEQIGIEYKSLPETDIKAVRGIIGKITSSSIEAAQEQKIYTKEISDIFNKLGISPVGIKKEDADQYKVERMQGIYNRITAEYPRPPDRRQYNSFPVPHQTSDGRIGANIPLFRVNSDKRTISVKGNTLEDYENKVFRKLSETYMINRQYLKSDDTSKRDIVQKSADAVKRFHRAAKTATVKQDADNFIKTVILEDEKRFTDRPSALGGGLTVSANANN